VAAAAAAVSEDDKSGWCRWQPQICVEHHAAIRHLHGTR
jgi:hypothetical protein